MRCCWWLTWCGLWPWARPSRSCMRSACCGRRSWCRGTCGRTASGVRMTRADEQTREGYPLLAPVALGARDYDSPPLAGRRPGVLLCHSIIGPVRAGAGCLVLGGQACGGHRVNSESAAYTRQAGCFGRTRMTCRSITSAKLLTAARRVGPSPPKDSIVPGYDVAITIGQHPNSGDGGDQRSLVRQARPPALIPISPRPPLTPDPCGACVSPLSVNTGLWRGETRAAWSDRVSPSWVGLSLGIRRTRLDKDALYIKI